MKINSLVNDKWGEIEETSTEKKNIKKKVVGENWISFLSFNTRQLRSFLIIFTPFYWRFHELTLTVLQQKYLEWNFM